MSLWLVAALLALAAGWWFFNSESAMGRFATQMARKLTYFPDRQIRSNPGFYGLAYESVTFAASDGVSLHGWWVPGPSGTEGRPALLFFHGNAGNIGDRAWMARELHERLGVGVFLVDYRGFGHSEGTPSEAGLYRDGRAAVEEMARRGWSGGGLILFGRSLGAGVALEVAEAAAGSLPPDKPFALVLEAPFTSLAEMGRHHYPLLGMLTAHIKEERYDNRAKSQTLSLPLLVIHGEDDQVAPPEMGRELYEAARGPKQWLEIKGAGHNDPPDRNPGAYWNGWISFLRGRGMLEQR